MQNTLPLPVSSSLSQGGNFSGHETFTFRYAWLKKGIDGLIKRPEIFQADDAMVELGVGKNMVRAIRHWCLATSVFEEGDYSPQTRTKRLVPSEFGETIFKDGGYDPYLEDDATPWLLHWHLANNASRATTWYWAFNLCKEQDFTRDSLFASLQRVVKEQNWPRISDSSLQSDIACFLRTYVPSKRGITSTQEETLDCPLANLGLIVDAGERDRREGKDAKREEMYRFVNGHKPGLPTAVFLYALLDFWQRGFAEQNTLSIRNIIYAEGSPGRVFRLDDDATLRHLDRLEEISKGKLVFSDTIQQRLVIRQNQMDKKEVLRDYYCG